MRILHTSDWHLGQYFMGKSRQAEHEALIAWLIEQTRLHAVDAVLIAGDVFDTGAPPSYARELYNRLIVALHDARVGLTVLAGNHDSVATMQESRGLLAYLGTVVIPAVEDDPRDPDPRAQGPCGPARRDTLRDSLHPPARRDPECRGPERAGQAVVAAGRDPRALPRTLFACEAKTRGARPRSADHRDGPSDDGRRKRERIGPRNLCRRARGVSDREFPAGRLHRARPYPSSAEGRRPRADPL